MNTTGISTKKGKKKERKRERLLISVV